MGGGGRERDFDFLLFFGCCYVQGEGHSKCLLIDERVDAET